LADSPSGFNELGAATAPLETDTPLTVDPDAVLTATIALQRFQPIARGAIYTMG
jgi:hypothetical protein